MAYATSVTIGTSSKVSADYQSQEIEVRCTYQLESQDTDLMAFVLDKTDEVERAHAAVWRRIRELRSSHGVAAPDNTTVPPDKSGNNGNHKRSKTTAKSETSAKPTDQPTQPELPEAPMADEPATMAQCRAIQSLTSRTGISSQRLRELIVNTYGKHTLGDLTRSEAAKLLIDLQKQSRPTATAA